MSTIDLFGNKNKPREKNKHSLVTTKMRAGICTIQQALTAEAASIVKQALTLARRRNHAQVTPLHVAISLLESSSSLLRKACLKSHSHPLQCKALELCFNVSLNRLPTSTSSPFLASHSSSSLSLSNALVAAFKRAQAHQRRGSIESQQQPILALKIEIEQLVISILDDPSVSRVMREAGFSSTQVKSNVEQAVSFEFCPQSPPLSSTSISKNCITPSLIQLGPTLAIKPINQVREKDVMSVLNALMRERKRNNVIVGECLASAENVVRGVMDKLERGDVNGNLRFMQFINLPLYSFKNVSKEEVEQKLVDLKCLVRTYIARGVVLYLGDLKWVTEFWSGCCEQKRSYYCPVQHMIMEIRRLVCGVFGDGGKLWLMGIANFQTYMKCKAGHPSLESLWDLRPLAIPVGSLGLSLTIDSDLQAESRSKVSTDWSVSFEREALSNVRSIPKSESTITTTTSMSSKLPSWLQHYKEENRTQTIDDHQENIHVGDLSKKWDSFFGSVQKQPHFSHKAFSSYSSPTSTSISSYDQRNPKLDQTRDLSWPVIFESKSLPKEHQFWMSEKDDEGFEANPRMLIPENNEPKPDLLSNPNSSPNSATSSEAGEGTEDLPMFKELKAENLSTLCNGLEKKVPWQKEIIPDIVNTVLQCRSGMIKRKGKLNQREEEKEETWLFFLGADTEGKTRIARELARLIFGSLSNFVSINSSSSFSSTRADSTDDFRNKRKRDELGGSYLKRFAEALHENPHRVFFVEEVEQLDYCSQMGMKRAIESGSITLPSGELVTLDDAIVIFSCESLSSMSRACSPPPIKRKCNESEDTEDDDDEPERSLPVSLDLNIALGGDTANEHSVSDIGIKDSVDRQIMFKIQEL